MRKRGGILTSSVIVIVLLLAGGLYLSRDKEHKTVDATARAGAGKFVALHDGVTQYELAGPDSGRAIVLLSGATVPYYIWDSTANALATNGFRVVRYNYFGRGLSDRPKLRYDLATYDRQLTDLLERLDVRGPIDVAGVSMGGVIAANFADQHPQRARSLILVDPAFSMFEHPPFPLRIPGVGEYIMTTAAGPGMAKGQFDDFLHPERYPDWATRYEPQMQYKGFLRSMLQTTRGDVFTRPASSFTTLARSRVPVLILWGKEDRTVAFAKNDAVRSAFPSAEFHPIDSAAHLPHIEQARLVDSIVLTFLRAHR